MKRITFAICLLFAGLFCLNQQVRQIHAQGYITTLMSPPGWVLSPTPQVDCYFANQAYYNCPLDTSFSVTRASTKYCQWQSQLWVSVSNNAPCITDLGWLIEESRTNLALWSRDLTQSGTWTAVTMTAAKNAVGIDGTANSATTLTATSPAATILQSLTAASTAYTYSVFVKGVTVTGAIQVADYPVLTPAFTTLTSSNCVNTVTGVGTAPVTGQTIFVRCTVTATSLNPVIGFKFANSGDSIVVDFNQLEAASFGTSPILTTSGSATRSADNTALSGLALSIVQATPYSFAAKAPWPSNRCSTAEGGVFATLGSNYLFVGVCANGASLTNGDRFDNGGRGAQSFNAAGVVERFVGSYGSGTQTVSVNGGAAQTSALTSATVTSAALGYYSGGSSQYLDGYLNRFALWPQNLSNLSITTISGSM